MKRPVDITEYIETLRSLMAALDRAAYATNADWAWLGVDTEIMAEGLRHKLQAAGNGVGEFLCSIERLPQYKEVLHATTNGRSDS